MVSLQAREGSSGSMDSLPCAISPNAAYVGQNSCLQKSYADFPSSFCYLYLIFLFIAALNTIPC